MRNDGSALQAEEWAEVAGELTAVLPRGILDEVPVDRCLFAQPCRGSDLRLLLLVISTPEQPVGPLDYLVASASILASVSLAPWRQLLAQQELAARVAHMSAGNILFAQYSLDASLASLGAEHPAATSIASAQTALREALASLDRTRFFGVPWNQRGQCVRIGPFIAALGAELNAQVRCALAKTTLKACRSERQLRVRASTERLRCALRDALLATWLLSEVRPVRLRLDTKRGRIRVRITAPQTGLPRPANKAGLLRLLLDPSEHTYSLQSPPAARGIGFYVPQKLIEEMGGQMDADLRGPRRALTITFTWPRV